MEEKYWKVPPDGFGVSVYCRKCTEILVNVKNMELKRKPSSMAKAYLRVKRERPPKTQVSRIDQEMS